MTKYKYMQNRVFFVAQKKEINSRVKQHQEEIRAIKKEISKIVVGQEDVITKVLRAVVSDGHVLLEGVPGTAKTLMVRAISQVTGCKFNRIQFTVDLLPTDILGITSFERERGFFVVKGPIFSNFILADEINRAPPKVQSALLECMQERQVTIGKETFPLDLPFIVLATQNPLESLGVYPLPEAQLDRFIFKIKVNYPNTEEERMILDRNINLHHFDSYGLKTVVSPDAILEMQNDVKEIYISKEIEDYIVKLIDATRNPAKYNISLGNYIEAGASPRASIGLFIASKAEAMMKGKLFVTPHNIKEVAYDVLRHRIILKYEGYAEGISSDNVIAEILSKVPVP